MRIQLTKAQLLAAMPDLEKNIKANKNLQGVTVDKVLELLNKYAEEFDIDSKMRWAHYLAQIGHECLDFRYTEEIASGAAYEGRKDLGNVMKGDGVRYKGRGCIQITGRANYKKYMEYCGYDLINNPELLCHAVGAIRSSMWFWQKRNLNYYADINAILLITKKINGGVNGYSDRCKRFERAKKALGI